MRLPKTSNSRARQDVTTAEESQEKEIQDRTSPPGEVVYGAVYREGEHELERSNRALAWSGLAAGLSMGFSFVAEALLRSRLPDARWVPIVSKLGYTIGFIIVILGRQQLFTKNTLTVILPLLNAKAKTGYLDVGRLWALVFFSNILGAFLFALLISQTSIFDSDVRSAFSTIAGQEFGHSFGSMFLKATLAGWLIALMIWLLPFAETARVGVIGLLAYIVGLGGFPHIVAGGIATFYAVLTGGISFAGSLTQFFAPVFLGNVVGGVTLVAAGAHAEFHAEHPVKH